MRKQATGDYDEHGQIKPSTADLAQVVPGLGSIERHQLGQYYALLRILGSGRLPRHDNGRGE